MTTTTTHSAAPEPNDLGSVYCFEDAAYAAADWLAIRARSEVQALTEANDAIKSVIELAGVVDVVDMLEWAASPAGIQLVVDELDTHFKALGPVGAKRLDEVMEANSARVAVSGVTRDDVMAEGRRRTLMLLGGLVGAVSLHPGAPAVYDVVEVVISKQKDYGHGNILAHGLEGIGVRMSDKVARLGNLTAKGAQPENESVADTLVDLIGYAIIAAMLLIGTFTLPLCDDLDDVEAG